MSADSPPTALQLPIFRQLAQISKTDLVPCMPHAQNLQIQAEEMKLPVHDPLTKFRKDYTPTPYLIDRLGFTLGLP